MPLTNLQSKIIYFIENSEKYNDSKVLIYESISTNQQNFDRHFTTFSKTGFVLEKIYWRISGGRMIIDGGDFYYEIWLDKIIDFQEIEEDNFVFLEEYSDKIYRQSKITFSKKIL